MAKGIGLIGNFRGKVGNMVGYNLKDSNNKQTQGVRVYQPVVKNPKTYGQAEQRAKLAPINATYRALKAIIDRGQEGKAYGNKSRLAWLSDAMKAFNGAWIEKGAALAYPAIVPLTKGSLAGLQFNSKGGDYCGLNLLNGADIADLSIGKVSIAIMAKYPQVALGDQISFVAATSVNNVLIPQVYSFVIDTTSTEVLPSTFDDGGDYLQWYADSEEDTIAAACIILSREGSNGEHLRSSASLEATSLTAMTEAMTTAAKEAAIKSYMSAGANTDWAEESLQ